MKGNSATLTSPRLDLTSSLSWQQIKPTDRQTSDQTNKSAQINSKLNWLEFFRSPSLPSLSMSALSLGPLSSLARERIYNETNRNIPNQSRANKMGLRANNRSTNSAGADYSAELASQLTSRTKLAMKYYHCVPLSMYVCVYGCMCASVFVCSLAAMRPSFLDSRLGILLPLRVVVVVAAAASVYLHISVFKSQVLFVCMRRRQTDPPSDHFQAGMSTATSQPTWPGWLLAKIEPKNSNSNHIRIAIMIITRPS